MANKQPLLFRFQTPALITKALNNTWALLSPFIIIAFYLIAFAYGETIFWGHNRWRITEIIGLIVYLPLAIALLFYFISCLKYEYAVFANRPDLLKSSKGKFTQKKRKGAKLMAIFLFVVSAGPLGGFLLWGSFFVPNALQDLAKGPVYYHGPCSVEILGSPGKVLSMSIKNPDKGLYALSNTDFNNLVTYLPDSVYHLCKADVSVWYVRTHYITDLSYSDTLKH